MTYEEFNQLVADRLAKCQATLCNREAVYSRNGDRLHNFKKAGRRTMKPPEDALLGMAEKHFTAIDDFKEDLISDVYVSNEQLEEKFTDAINYLLLLEGLLQERRHNLESMGQVPIQDSKYSCEQLEMLKSSDRCNPSKGQEDHLHRVQWPSDRNSPMREGVPTSNARIPQW